MEAGLLGMKIVVEGAWDEYLVGKKSQMIGSKGLRHIFGGDQQ